MNRTARLCLVAALIGAAIWAVQQYTTGGPNAGPSIDSDIPMPSGTPESVGDKETRYPRAKEFVSPGEFFNVPPFTVASLIGKKVILVDFWTYSCINCQRTQPYLNAWYEKYHDKGLVIVGVHTPEFEFEKIPDNVKAAIAKAGIKYAVVQDNEFGTWKAYRNQYWPHKYLIDTDGYIIYDHIGEGGYDETEREIQQALEEHMARTGMKGTAIGSVSEPSSTTMVDFKKIQTPELYLGAFRNEQFVGNADGGKRGSQTMSLPDVNEQDVSRVYFGGEWDFVDQSVRCIRDCVVRLTYSARQVNLVASSVSPAAVRVRLDGVPADDIRVQQANLYRLVDLATYGQHTIELVVPAGIDLFTFTFS